MNNITLLESTDEEITKLQDFLNESWAKDHILVKNKSLLKWQHKSFFDVSKINFFIGKDCNDQITSCLGIIPATANSIRKESDLIWLTTWISNIPYEGIALLSEAIKYFNPIQVAAIGINDKVAKLYKILGYTVDKFNHFYLSIKNNKSSQISKTSRYFKFNNSEFHKLKSNNINAELYNYVDPKFISINKLKNKEYLNHRYINHPKYKYMTLDIKRNNIKIAKLIVRKIVFNKSSCLRIVDTSEIKISSLKDKINCRFAIINLLIKLKIEYIDIFTSDEASFVAYLLGFIKVNKERDIVPDYFEPFLKENIDIRYAYKNSGNLTNNKNLDLPGIFFKGDSDMDRPNI